MIKSNINDYTAKLKLEDNTNNRIWYKAVINNQSEITDIITTDLSLEQPNNNEVPENKVKTLLDENNMYKWKMIEGIISTNTNIIELKKNRIFQIDNKTIKIIRQGVAHNNSLFSMSNNAQKNWTGLEVKKSSLTFPIFVTTKDDLEYEFSNVADLENFTDKVLLLVYTQQAIGRKLKISINNATTKSQINAIVDNR